MSAFDFQGIQVEDLKDYPNHNRLHYQISPDAPIEQEFYARIFIANSTASLQGELAPYALPDWLTYTSGGIINTIRTRFFPMQRAEGIFFLIGYEVFILRTVSDDAGEEVVLHWRKICDFLYDRNTKDGVNYPDRELQIAEEQQRAEEAERINRARESEDAQKARRAATLSDLLNLPDKDFRPRELVARLKKAGITVSPRTIELKVAAATREPKVKGETKDCGKPLLADRSLATDILTEIFNKQKKQKK